MEWTYGFVVWIQKKDWGREVELKEFTELLWYNWLKVKDCWSILRRKQTRKRLKAQSEKKTTKKNHQDYFMANGVKQYKAVTTL